jgi:dTDP-4-amino-4,6-dideoxygalactose transaminase
MLTKEASHAGPPTRFLKGTEMIPMSRPTFGPEEEEAVLAVMRSGRFAQGERVQAFEEAFAAATGARFAIATSSGTSALFLALLAHGIGPGDEVITTPLTFIATANAIAHAGARPAFADVDDSLNLDPEAAAGQVGLRTRAIVPVHLHGNPCDAIAFSRTAAERDLVVVQDACQAVGAIVAGVPLGAHGTAVYSFYATKNITTGEGGMVTCNDRAVADRCASLRHQAYTSLPYVHDRSGYNFRMTELQAAIGLVQLGRLQAINERRRRIAAYYDSVIPLERFPRPRVLPEALHVYHQYTLRLPLGRDDVPAREARDAVLAALEEAGVMAAVYYPVPVHLQPVYRDGPRLRFPEAEQAAGDMFSIPIHHALDDAEVEAVATAVSRL